MKNPIEMAKKLVGDELEYYAEAQTDRSRAVFESLKMLLECGEKILEMTTKERDIIARRMIELEVECGELRKELKEKGTVAE